MLPRLLLSDKARERLAGQLAGLAEPVTIDAVEAGAPFELAFVSRDITGLSTKHEIEPATARYYSALRGQPDLRWVQVHSAGVDREVYVDLIARGIKVTTGAGVNAAVVAQTALAGVLALARHLPAQIEAQRERRWAPLIGGEPPRDLASQHAVVVGWGAIGQQIGHWLAMLGLKVTAVRRAVRTGPDAGAAVATAVAGPDAGDPAGPIGFVTYETFGDAAASADWLILACPLTPLTRRLVDAALLARLPAGARLVNVARGDVVDEAALIAALDGGRLAGAFLDVFAHEPLASDSPLWTLPGVIATAHSAGVSDGNQARLDGLFLDNLARWRAGQGLRNLASACPD